MWKNFEDNKLR